MPIVLAAPVAAPYTPEVLIPLEQRWTGFDGSEWVLSDWQQMPCLRPGVTGLHMPRMNVFESSTPLVPGVELTGYSIEKRPVYWPLVFRASSISEWAATYSGFFDSIHPVESGTWTVGSGADARKLRLTGDFSDSYAWDRDPFTTGFAQIGVELVAARPLWEGEPIEQEFTAGAGTPFIDPTAPPFNISDARSFSNATISNPGNEPAYLKWTLIGPFPSVSVGVGGAVISVPFTLNTGDVLEIDTDPAGQYATLNGVDKTRDLGFQLFAPVPARGESPLVITSSGTGTVKASLTPLYWRAF